MDMAEKPRPKRASGSGSEGAGSQASAMDSGKALARGKGRGTEIGNGGEGLRMYVNERGETCLGTECFLLAIDEQRREIRVNVKRGATCNVDPFVDSLRKTLGAGSRTVYEVESEYREDTPGDD